MLIRPAKEGDATVLTDLCMVSKQSNGYDDAFMEACREELRVTPERLGSQQFWVAENAPHICGCVCLEVDSERKRAEVCAFFVHPDWQRKGVGRLLWVPVLQAAGEQNLEMLHLDADPAAVPFYQSLGFVTVGENPSGSIPGRTIPYMELPLDGMRAST